MTAEAAFWAGVEALRGHLAAGRRGTAMALLARLRRAAAADPLTADTRLALLREIAGHGRLGVLGDAAKTGSDTGENTLPPALAEGPLRLLVSGIGRSGTTLIYQQLAKLLRLETEAVNFRYEPYLWAIRTPGTAGNGFGPEQFHHFGLHTHQATPLFLDGPHPLHDRFLDHLFADPLDADPARAARAHLVKVIRGSGRLRAYLGRFPDLRVVICLRNPLDTINSSLGMFSLFGEEFHADDRPRFAAELARTGRAARALPAARNAVEWLGAWWRAFTEESLAVAADHPDACFLFCHERFRADPDGVLDALAGFVGIDNPGLRMGLDRPAGPSIRATSLTAHDIDRLAGETAWYRDTVLARFLGPEAARAETARGIGKYASGRFSFPVAGSDLGRESPIQLRSRILKGAQSPFQRLVSGARTPLDLAALIARHGGGADPATLRRPVADPEALKRGRSFGAVLTCHNNAGTIVDAVLSCLGQTLPFDRIVVVDDRSEDSSPEKLALLAERYSSIEIVTLASGVGPAAARDIGIRRIGTDYVTQLDGDDLFWPTKNAAEAAAIAAGGGADTVAFSDILLVQPDRSFLQDTSVYEGESGAALFARILARTPQIPRDMTLPRARYFEAGGYDPTARLYEDWEFKLRLAALPGLRWRRAEGVAGTVYNRLSPGLSGVHPGNHARALALIFLASLGGGRGAGLAPEALLEAYDAALRPFAARNITAVIRAWLAERLARGGFDPAEAAALAGARRTRAMDDAALAALFASAPAEAAGAAP